MEITIKTPADFSFRRTVPKPVTVEISPGNRGINISTSGRVGKQAAAAIERDVRHMFRLDDDLGEFYQAVKADPDFAWVAQEGAGRLLRSPTVFEDLVKMICTTNCSWALTDKMVIGLVNELGRESADGRKSFPTAAAMAEKPETFFREQIRAGYRAPYLAELAQRVASGSLDVEAWLTSDLPLSDLIKEMKSIKGVGNYAAENLLKLIGRYDGLALDSWTRARFARLRNNGRVASDKKISRFYSRFKSWRGLALWCDVTHDWLDPENIAK